MDDQLLQAAPPSDGKVAIWCPAERLGDFITGLNGDFMIGREDLLGLHHLIEQRVHYQNEAQLVQFVAALRFDDGLSVEIGSIEEFERYAEVRALVTHHVSLSWVYLVKFIGRNTPERQKIEVTFTTRSEVPDYVDAMYMARRLRYTDSLRTTTGAIIRISHTMRSWGMDLESLLTDHVRVLLREKKTTVPRYMAQFSGAMSFITFAVVQSVLLLQGVQLLRFVTRSYVVGDLSTKATWDELLRAQSHKFDLLYAFLGGGRSVTLTAGSIMYIVFGILFSVWAATRVGKGANSRRPSFIVFTPRDERHRDTELRKFRSRWQRTAFGFCFSVVGGVIANAVTVLLW